MVGMPTAKPILPPSDVHAFLTSLFEEDLHAKRIFSLADGTLGVMHSAALGVHAIGRGLAAVRGLTDKHAVKQMDRLLSNLGINVPALLPTWIRHVVGTRERVVVNMDWTDFDADDHTMIVLSMQTDHGRSTPLAWKTVVKSKLKGARNDAEDDLLHLLVTALPAGAKLIVVADRGFGDAKLYNFITDLGHDYVIRFRQSILVTSSEGVTRKAVGWVEETGRAKLLREATVTADKVPVGAVLCVRDPGMKDAWCLATSLRDVTAGELKKLYGRRFTIEEMFRDIKDMRFGLGMGWQRIGSVERRDRMFLLAAFAQGLLTLLGQAGEAAGLDRLLKTNTSKTRQLSLLRQGILWYERIPAMPEARLATLLSAFQDLLRDHPVYSSMAGL